MTFKDRYKQARNNAAGLIGAMDLEQLYGGDEEVEGHEDQMELAQKRVVEFLRME